MLLSKKQASKLAGLLVLGASSLFAPTVAKAVDTIPILLCPFGCGPMAGDTILMNQLIKSGSDVVLLPQETPGYMYNIREMGRNERKWKSSIFKTEDTLIQVAFAGGSKEMKEFVPEPVQIEWKLLYGETWWGQGKFLGTYDCSLKTMSDLKGKRISLGLRGQSDWGVFPRLLLEEVFGVTPENTDIRHMSPGQLPQQLIDGVTDAAIIPIGAEPNFKEFMIPGVVRQHEATGKKMCYIGVTESDIDKLNEKFQAGWLHTMLPANTLPHQSEPLGIAVNRSYAAVHEIFDEEKAYKTVMAVAKIAPEMKELHALWRVWSPELMTCGLSEDNAHPGAVRAYKELGWWKDSANPLCTPVTYPKVN
jgi:TRAP-type uncharacterized transport system substrate-binding protein